VPDGAEGAPPAGRPQVGGAIVRIQQSGGGQVSGVEATEGVGGPAASGAASGADEATLAAKAPSNRARSMDMGGFSLMAQLESKLAKGGDGSPAADAKDLIAYAKDLSGIAPTGELEGRIAQARELLGSGQLDAKTTKSVEGALADLLEAAESQGAGEVGFDEGATEAANADAKTHIDWAAKMPAGAKPAEIQKHADALKALVGDGAIDAATEKKARAAMARLSEKVDTSTPTAQQKLEAKTEAAECIAFAAGMDGAVMTEDLDFAISKAQELLGSKSIEAGMKKKLEKALFEMVDQSRSQADGGLI